MDEKEARQHLTKYRRLATSFQGFKEEYGARIDKHPEMEADLIVNGDYHKAAAHFVAGLLAAASAGDMEGENPECTRNVTEEQWERSFREHYSPFGVVQDVILPLIMYGLEDYEQLFIENCWKLTRWNRPDWLKEVEKEARKTKEVNYENTRNA